MKRFLSLFLSFFLLLTALMPLNAQAEDDTVTVIADGVSSTARIGDVIRYTYSLDLSGIDIGEDSIPGRITEIEGCVEYDSASLRLLTDLSPDENDRVAALPRLFGGAEIVNRYLNAVYYNALKLNGYLFDKKTALIQLDFEVIGSGTAAIDNHLSNLGSGEVRMIYLDEVIVEPVTATDLYPYDVGDVDMDGFSCVLDVTLMQEQIAELIELTPIQMLLAEFNGDGEFNLMDATALQYKIAFLPYISYR